MINVQFVQIISNTKEIHEETFTWQPNTRFETMIKILMDNVNEPYCNVNEYLKEHPEKFCESLPDTYILLLNKLFKK